MPELRAVILDLDGTLIDSNDAHARAWVDVCRELGLDVGFEQARPLIGMGGDKVTPMLTGLEPESDEGRRARERSGEIFRTRYLGELRPQPGARELLGRLRADGLELVVATSASRQDMRALLAHVGIDDLIEDATSSSDAEESKPDPDIVRAALRQAGVPADAAVMLGDTPYDVAACARAGVRCIALRCGGWWADDAFDGAAGIYEDPAALLAEWEEERKRLEADR